MLKLSYSLFILGLLFVFCTFHFIVFWPLITAFMLFSFSLYYGMKNFASSEYRLSNYFPIIISGGLIAICLILMIIGLFGLIEFNIVTSY